MPRLQSNTKQAQITESYSERRGGGKLYTHHTLTVSSEESKSADTIKGILKSHINPTEIKVGINALKTLRNGKVQIEAQNKEDR